MLINLICLYFTFGTTGWNEKLNIGSLHLLLVVTTKTVTSSLGLFAAKCSSVLISFLSNKLTMTESGP